MNGTELVGLMTVVAGVATIAIALLRGPIGKAFAQRLAGTTTVNPDIEPEVGRLHSELDEMKQRLAEAEERLDFAERLLARQRQESLGPGK